MMTPLHWLNRKVTCCYNHLLFRYKNVNYPETLQVNGKLKILGTRRPCIQFGKDVHINSSIESNPSGGKQTIFMVGENAQLTIGNNSGISNSTIVCKQSITIGSNVNIGANNVIYDTDFHSVNFEDRIHCPDENVKIAPVVIEDGVWIAGHCVILKGSRIGKRSVIAAGSVVTSTIPADELWGVPAKFIRKIN